MSCSRWILLFCVFCSVSVYGQLDASLARKVDSIFSRWDKTNSPGCAIAIVKDGKIIYERGYGMANLEYGIAITPKSRFHVASISKQFTAAAVQKLALEGKLSLNDDIRKYIPELPDYGHVITVANLIHHTSGLRDQWDLQYMSGWRDDDVITEKDIMDMTKRQRGLNFNPGDDYSYCNTGFTLLGVIVKRVTGVSLRDYADSVFFQPLGMTSTVFHSDHTEIVTNRTSAYRQTDDHRWAISIPVFDNYGATSLFTTVEDLAKWDENFYTHRVGGEAFIHAMLEPGVLNNGERQTYASGLSLGEYHGNKTVEHSGSDAGYRANFLRFPDRHLSIIILANLANINPYNLSRRVANLFLPAGTGDVTKVVLVDSAVARKWSGSYFDTKSKVLSRISFEPVAGFPNASLKSYGNDMRALSDSSFVDDNGTQYTFSTSAGPASGSSSRGAVWLRLHNAGMADRRLEKVVPLALPLSAAVLAEYAGMYYSDELAADLVVSVKDTSLMIKTPRNEPEEMGDYARDVFVDPFIVEFVRDKRGKVIAMVVSTGRSKGIYFDREREK